MNSRTVLFMPDLHVPDHDTGSLDCFVRALTSLKPDELCILGDYLDCKAPARWSKATADEYAGTLVKEIETGKHILSTIRNLYDGRITFLKGNHEARIDSYLNRYAPAVKELVPPLSELLGFNSCGVDLQSQPYNVAPGVVAIHGSLLSSVLGAAGQSAFKERVRHGMSIVQGHSHRLGIGWDKQDKARFWMECGHLMDQAKAGYLDFGHANWQQGLGILHIRDTNVFPTVHAIHDGRSAFDPGQGNSK